MTKDRKEQAQYLMAQYIAGKTSEREQDLLFRFLHEEGNDGEWEELIEELMMAEPEEEKYKNMDWQPAINGILNKESTKEAEAKTPQIGKVRKGLFVRMTAAAAILVVLSLTAVFLLKKDGPANRGTAQNPLPSPVASDIAPGGDRAILTLADGRQIVLDTASNGALAQQAGIKVIKIGGRLSYDAEANTSQVLYNTVTTPKGGQFQLELADGSKVWLNAASSLRFPTAFAGKERTVELSGEGYFEVAPNPALPFHVKVNDMDVQVLGTHFNINSYSNEPNTKTTLLEGRVSVKRNGKHAYLTPGQQAVIQPGQDNIRVAYDVDVEEVVAWKNGRFLFSSADIETIMRQMERWYDVEVVYEKKIPETISGGLPRSQNVSQLLKILEATGKVDFEVKGRQIIVKPK